MYVVLILSLFGCPTSSAESCPEDVPLGDPDMGCDCHGTELDALPGSGDIVCTGQGLEVHTYDTADCKSLDCD